MSLLELKRGDYVTMRHGSDSKVAMVVLVSENQRSIFVHFAGGFLGCFGGMPLLFENSDYRNAMGGQAVELQKAMVQ